MEVINCHGNHNFQLVDLANIRKVTVNSIRELKMGNFMPSYERSLIVKIGGLSLNCVSYSFSGLILTLPWQQLFLHVIKNFISREKWTTT